MTDQTFSIQLCGFISQKSARLVWQRLFDLYRENGGNLDDMSDMLIDYDHVKDACADAICGYSSKFIWGLCADSGNTYARRAVGDCEGSGLRKMLSHLHVDVAVIVEISKDLAVFTVLDNGQ